MLDLELFRFQKMSAFYYLAFLSMKYALSETVKEIIQVSMYVQDFMSHLLLHRMLMEFGWYKTCESTLIKRQGLKRIILNMLHTPPAL